MGGNAFVRKGRNGRIHNRMGSGQGKLIKDKSNMWISGKMQDMRKITKLNKNYIEYREKEQ